jgi:hypothetical protein
MLKKENGSVVSREIMIDGKNESRGFKNEKTIV